MRAILPSAEGPVLQDIPMSVIEPEEVLVRVRAAALNRADLAMLKGASHGSVGGKGIPLGLEWAGEIVEVGGNAGQWRVGDCVMAGSGGAFTEYVVGHARRMYAIPDGMSFEQAATLPVALQTMHDAISTNGNLQAGQSVLIQGATSGVGLMGLQVAKFLGASLVIGSSTSDERCARLAEFGADLAINTRDSDWVEKVHAATGGKGVDVLIDHVAGPLMNGNLKATCIGGRIVNVGRLGGMNGEMDFDLHALRRINYIGVTFRTRNAAEVERIIELTARVLGPALNEGKLKLPIDSVYPLEKAGEAYGRMVKNEHFGKIVLSLA